MKEYLSIKDLYTVLGELIADGYGNKQFQISYDNETKHTHIPVKSRVFVHDRAIRFSDYKESFIEKDRTIEGILENLKKEKDNEGDNDCIRLNKEVEEYKQTIDTICKDYEASHGMSIRNAEWFTAW